jgi:Fe-S-cluster containining protein
LRVKEPLGPYEVLYRRIPAFRCKPGCSACCGPVPFSRTEWERIPDKKTAAGIDCPYSGTRGCAIYENRPFMCRLFGAAASLSCPFGSRPDRMLSAEEAAELTGRYMELMRAEDLGAPAAPRRSPG